MKLIIFVFIFLSTIACMKNFTLFSLSLSIFLYLPIFYPTFLPSFLTSLFSPLTFLPFFRLILGCERIRKLLSQLPESSITVENMSDNGDVNFSLKRDELSLMCADLLNGFKALIRQALLAAGVTSTGTSLLV